MKQTISFEEAKLFALARAQLHWNYALHGAPHAAGWGYEDDDSYLVFIDTAGFIVERDLTRALLGGGSFFVDRRTGAITNATYLIHHDRVDRMRPIGEVNPWEATTILTRTETHHA